MFGSTLIRIYLLKPLKLAKYDKNLSSTTSRVSQLYKINLQFLESILEKLENKNKKCIMMFSLFF